MHRCFRQLSIRARRLVLVLCALMLVVQPVGAAAGELHELAHDPSGGHAGLVLGGAPMHATVDDTSAGKATGVLHVLVDVAHGGGPGAAMAPVLHFTAAIPDRDPLGGIAPPSLKEVSLAAPFKPPRMV